MVWCFMPYATDTTGAISFPLRTVDGVEAVIVRLTTRLQTIQGEWPSDTSIGLPWLDWIEEGRVATPEAEALVRGQVEDDPAVVSVDAVTVATTGEAVALTVRATIATEGDTAPVVLTVGSDPYATRGAPPWYLSSGALRYTRGAYWSG